MLNLLKKFYQDSLFRNSIYLMSATAVAAGFGFFFWLINSRLFLTEEIGLATGLISVMSLISILSLIGFNATFIRFLPNSEQRNDKLNTGLLLVGVAALLLSGGFVLLAGIISPPLHSILSTPLHSFLFVLFSVLMSVSAVTESVFLAYRETKFIFAISVIFNFFKVLLPFAFLASGAFGIFAAAATAQALGFVLSITILVWKFNYRPRFVIHHDILALVWRFSATNYAASVLNLLPVTLLPIIIVNYLGAHEAAYYYIAMMIGNLLYTIPWATARSLFAEGSNDEAAFASHIKKAVSVITLLLVPSVLFLFFAGGLLLQIFGPQYLSEGAGLLRLIVLTGIAISASAIVGSLFQVKKNLQAIIITNTIFAAVTITLSFALLSLGLVGIGIAWLVGNTTAAVVGYVLYRWGARLSTMAQEGWYIVKAISIFKTHYFLQVWQQGFSPKVILFYPEKPMWFHFVYAFCHLRGVKITTNPNSAYDFVFRFEDTTFGKDYPLLTQIAQTRAVVNNSCLDISKEKVEEVFQEVFGYGMKVDPRHERGVYVRKSNSNATHDGKVIQGPTQPEEGCVYQKLVNNQFGDVVVDLRVTVMKDEITLLCLRYKSSNDRFDNSRDVKIVAVSEEFSPDEVQKMLTFCKKFGLECGELDVVRDRDNGRIYILDANNTHSIPRTPHTMTKEMYKKYFDTLLPSFERIFLIKNH